MSMTRDTEIGIAIRFIKQWDIVTDKYPHRFDVEVPIDWLTDEVRAWLYDMENPYLGFLFI